MTSEQIRAGVANADDQVLHVLANEQRRNVLTALETTRTPIALADLAIELARRKTGDYDSDLMFETAKQIRVRLHHCHLPKLEEIGLIDYTIEKKLVSLSDGPHAKKTAESLKPQNS